MIEEILPDLYRIEIPLPKNPLKYLNSYLIKDESRFLLIDTGFNRQECRQVMTAGLEKLGVDLQRTDLFITHIHSDHMGQAAVLATDSSKVYFSQKESRFLSRTGSEWGWRWAQMEEFYAAHGFPPDELSIAAGSHPGKRFAAGQRINFTTVQEGDMIEIGDYCFRCIATPGHSPEHMCLYEANKKILVAGDHVLFDITPNISYWTEMENPLKEYLASLEKVYTLEVDLLLPGHRSLLNDHRKRIRELQEHHRNRLNEVISALEEGEKNTFQIAPCISWDIKSDSWEEFPPTQKWFAFGETLAHLIYLEGEGKIRKETKGNEILYSLA